MQRPCRGVQDSSFRGYGRFPWVVSAEGSITPGASVGGRFGVSAGGVSDYAGLPDPAWVSPGPETRPRAQNAGGGRSSPLRRGRNTAIIKQHHNNRRSHGTQGPRAQLRPPQAHRGAGAGRRARQPPEKLDRPARQAGGVLRRQVPHRRLRVVELPELRHPPHRRDHAVQVAQPAAPPAARLGVPEDRDERVRRPAAGAAAHRRRALVPRHRRRGVPEPGHPGRLRAPTTSWCSPATTSTR